MSGDTVLVAPGTYVENIDFLGKAITVASSGGAATTIIDGSQGPFAVSFASGETRLSVINGFTIKNAGTTLWPDQTPTEFAGIKVSSSDPSITNDVITQNYGYGIFLVDSGALISGNTISYTSTAYDPRFDFGCDYDDGDGIFLLGAPYDPSVTTTISSNTIEYNVGHCLGGGIGIYATSATITNNIIKYNQSLGEGGGIWGTSGSPIIQNLIYGNIAGVAGGGIYFGNAADLFIVNNMIVGNTIALNGDILGGYVDGSQIAFGGSVTGTAFFNNVIVAGDTYGAISCNPDYQYLSPTPLEVDNSDILNFSGPAFSGWCVVPPTVTKNAISSPPLFVASGKEPFRLQPGSPALGSGDTSAPSLPSQDFDGNPRIQNGAVDMGVYEGAATGTNNPAPDFAITTTPTSLTIQAGQSGTATVTITPVGGLIGAVTFSCSQLPANTTCSFSPAGLAAGGDNAVISTTLTVNVSASGSSRPARKRRTNSPRLGLLLFSGGLFSIVMLVGVEARGFRSVYQFFMIVVCLRSLASLGIIASCGGNSGSGQGPPPPPPNQTVITAAATGNSTGATHAFDLSITITQ